jgi:ABC-type ATPase involved in cell division
MAGPLVTFNEVVGVTQECPLRDDFPVSFDLHPGECGIFKGGVLASSLARMAALRGILTHGSITIMDVRIKCSDNPAKYLAPDFIKKFIKSIGFCHHEGGLIANMTIIQNVMLPAHYHSSSSHMKPFFELAKVRLDEINVPHKFWECRPCDASPEIRQRALLARSIAHNPPVLILDDPTDDVPWGMTHEIVEWVLRQKNIGRGVLIATSNEPFAALVGDWMVDLDTAESFANKVEIRHHLGRIVTQSSDLLRMQMKAGENHAS